MARQLEVRADEAVGLLVAKGALGRQMVRKLREERGAKQRHEAQQTKARELKG